MDNENLIGESDNNLFEEDIAQLANSKETFGKVRKLCNAFNRPNFLRALRKYSKNKLETDCKTRWSSMYLMIASFNKSKDSIKKALIDLNEPYTLSEAEHMYLTTLERVLKPAYDAVLKLSKKGDVREE